MKQYYDLYFLQRVKFKSSLNDHIDTMTRILTELLRHFKLIEDDKIVKEQIVQKTGEKSQDILKEVKVQRNLLTNRFDDDPEIVMTDERYGFIAGIIKETVATSSRQRVDISRNIDLILTNRFVGFPIFIFFIWAMFQLTPLSIQSMG